MITGKVVVLATMAAVIISVVAVGKCYRSKVKYRYCRVVIEVEEEEEEEEEEEALYEEVCEPYKY